MVASQNALAAEAGAEILRTGGNAVDAAVATGFALAVTFPEAGNLGGGGYMVIRLANGKTFALDYREMAPSAASRNMYLDATGKPTNAKLFGRLASGVPGSVAGMSEALAKYGTMSLAQVMAPAIRLADEGFVADSTFSEAIRETDSTSRERSRKAGRELSPFSGIEAFMPAGKPVPRGTRVVQPKLAATLKLIARKGPDAFYRGPIAGMIEAEMSRDCVRGGSPSPRSCGLITKRDLANYRFAWRRPVRTTYRGYVLLTMPPSSSGGIIVSETLNVLERFDSLPAFGSAKHLHILREVLQRTFIDRNFELGDPDFVRIPFVRLTSKTYAEGLRKSIDTLRATPSSIRDPNSREGTETTSYSVVDKYGNAVATTTTLNELFGSGIYVADAGFFLNDEMDDLAAKPGSPNTYGLVEGEQNAVAPGKRPLSAMSPTIVLDPEQRLFLVLGARGGPRIITSVAQVILNVIDYRMSLSDAMSAPRIHFQWLPDSLRVERGGFTQSALDSLRAMGHNLQFVNYVGAKVAAIMRVPGGYVGMDDPRSSGAAVGY